MSAAPSDLKALEVAERKARKAADTLKLAALQDVPYRKVLRRELIRAAGGTRKAQRGEMTP